MFKFFIVVLDSFDPCIWNCLKQLVTLYSLFIYNSFKSYEIKNGMKNWYPHILNFRKYIYCQIIQNESITFQIAIWYIACLILENIFYFLFFLLIAFLLKLNFTLVYNCTLTLVCWSMFALCLTSISAAWTLSSWAVRWSDVRPLWKKQHLHKHIFYPKHSRC